MCGTTKNQEHWDPDSTVPPPNPVKEDKSIPKTYTHDTAYNITSNDILFEKV